MSKFESYFAGRRNRTVGVGGGPTAGPEAPPSRAMASTTGSLGAS